MSRVSPYTTPYGGAGGGGGGGRATSTTSYYHKTSNNNNNNHDEGGGGYSTHRRGRDEREDHKDWMKNTQQSQRNSNTQVFSVHVPATKYTSSSSSSSSAPTTASSVSATAASSSSSSSSSSNQVLSGVVMNALTPFDAQTGNIDLAVLNEYTAASKADGVKGVIVSSPFVGEGNLLSVSEQEQVLSAWCRAGVPTGVWINAGGPQIGATLVQAAKRNNASCVVIGYNTTSSNGTINDSSSSSAADAARFLDSINLRNASIPFLISVPPGLVGSAADDFISGVSRIEGFRGVVATQLSHVVSAAASGKAGTILFSSANGYDDLQCISAAASGATGVVSDHCSVIAPLMNRLFQAGAKGDQANAAKMGKLFAQYLGGFPAQRSLHVAALKTLLALRLDLAAAGLDVRAPTPQLSAGDLARLKQRMEAFVKSYVAAVQGTAAPATSSAAPAAAKKVNVIEMPGYRGQLNDLIIRRIEACERLTQKSNMINKFPHLSAPNGEWRTRRAGANPGNYVDHTLLKAEAKDEEVVKLVTEAKTHGFYAVCVNGGRARRAVELARGTSVEVAAVIGFPLGAGTIRAKAEEAGELVHEVGVNEIDMVMNIGAFKDKDYRWVYEDIKAVVRASAPAIVKVIFETCLLSQEEIIDASVLSLFAGAQFIKTSTGFNKGGATPDAIDVMLAVAGEQAEVKASGGVRDFETAMAYIKAGVTRIGTSSGVAIVQGKPAGAGY